MEPIFALIDYQGYFESKYNAIPYISGMDKKLLQESFLEQGYQLVFLGFSDVINYPGSFWTGKYVIYTSSEDSGYHYKDFIEDIVYYLELCHAKTVPSYKYLRANNNKVFMELLRNKMTANPDLPEIKTSVFGCYEEAERISEALNYPVVFKKASGAMSKGVGLLKNKGELTKELKKVSRTKNLFKELWEYGRTFKYQNYKKESKFRNKFILQRFIPNLTGDYKILIFSDCYFVLLRGLKPNDFRASGSGIRKFIKNIPDGLLEFAANFYDKLGVPNASLDIGYDGTSFFLIEFQCLYFGSYTLTFSDFYWKREEGRFQFCEGKSVLEKVYASSITRFIKSL